MNYELAKQLKDAGFPQDGNNGFSYNDASQERWKPPYMTPVPFEWVHENCSYVPTLEELIEACGEALPERRTFDLEWVVNHGWMARMSIEGFVWTPPWSPTPAEAIARLWLVLKKS